MITSIYGSNKKLSYQIKFAQIDLTKFAPKPRSIRTAGQRLDDLYNL